jgi:hypothetical protein
VPGVDVPALDGEITRLSDLHLTALETLYTAELDCGRHAEVLPELADLVRQYPLNERSHGLYITALARAGRRAEALAAYQSAAHVIADELGIDPGPALRQVHEWITTDVAHLGTGSGREQLGNFNSLDFVHFWSKQDNKCTVHHIVKLWIDHLSEDLAGPKTAPSDLLDLVKGHMLIVKQFPTPPGGSLPVPKQVLQPREKLSRPPESPAAFEAIWYMNAW